MNDKLKLAMLALLGFSTACGASKQAPVAGKDAQTQQADVPVVDSLGMPPIRVMYGVRRPQVITHIPSMPTDSAMLAPTPAPVMEQPAQTTDATTAPVEETGK